MDVDPDQSAILRARFGHNWRSWAAFREQWTKLSITVVGVLWAIIVAITLWTTSLKTRVVVLETQVLPVLNESKVESNNALRLTEVERRITRLENNLDLDLNEKLRAAQKAEEAAAATGKSQ